MNTLLAINARKSVRCYEKSLPEDEVIEIIAAAGTKAPKVGQLHITVVTNADILAKIDDFAMEDMKASPAPNVKKTVEQEGFRPLYGAPLLFVLSTEEDSPFGMTGPACAATQMALAATDMGVASCVMASVVGTLKKSACKALLELPKGFTPALCIVAGYYGGEAFTRPPKTVEINYIS